MSRHRHFPKDPVYGPRQEVKPWPRRRVTWEEANRIFPGCEAQWRSMVGDKTRTLTPKAGVDFRLEIVERPDEPDKPGRPSLHVIQIDYKDHYGSPPTWTTSGDGEWYHPMTTPRGMVFYLDYRYDFKKDDEK